ncbi:PHP domain-containing protein [Thorsellia anophelis]|uniref:Polymerase/histidinol phosphatase N-terminal domain-containing protein n=1 Tax=Thorsellia anophelis DSM 18579 TaxID=1123402 RepID=A0A1I0BC92_9GAMM|nr:PHP domain-containing protein [Thorsellia anophelis]SET03798.1 hypothetical protein SAMN02583745_01215 [Thorsellia anophelis DSM 18579]
MINLIIYDLHSHTNASDGKFSPELLIERAIERKVNYLAITDHDCTDAIPFALKKINENKLPIQLISGVEISTCWLSHDIHIVGLNLDINHPALTNLLATQATVRYDRAKRISEKLEKIEVYNSLSEIEASLSESQSSPFPIMLTRNHFATHLVQIGKVKSHQKAFDKILGKGSVGYVRAEWCDMQVAIDVIHKAGGKAVLAHPFAYPLKGKWGRRLVEAFAEMGGDALEVTNSQLTPDKRTHFAKLAQEFKLYVSVGSDFHYPTPWYDLGKNLWLPANVKPIWETFL